jgi:hypothetical protein
MRYSFLILFALMFMGMNALNAQTCCDKAKASTTSSASVSEKKSGCDMAKATASTASASKCSEASTASAQTSSSLAVFVNGITNFSAPANKSCDPSNCDLSKCDPSKCLPTGTMKASTTKAVAKTTKATAAL